MTVERIVELWKEAYELDEKRKQDKKTSKDNKRNYKRPGTLNVLPGVSEEIIKKAEDDLGLPLPQTFKDLYRLANGQDNSEASKGLWGDKIVFLPLDYAICAQDDFMEDVLECWKDDLSDSTIEEINNKDKESEEKGKQATEIANKNDSNPLTKEEEENLNNNHNNTETNDNESLTNLTGVKRSPLVTNSIFQPLKSFKTEYTFRSIDRTREEIRKARMENNFIKYKYKSGIIFGMSDDTEESHGYVLLILENEEKQIVYDVCYWVLDGEAFIPFGLGLCNIRELLPINECANFLLRYTKPSPSRFDEWLEAYESHLEKNIDMIANKQYHNYRIEFTDKDLEGLFMNFHINGIDRTSRIKSARK